MIIIYIQKKKIWETKMLPSSFCHHRPGGVVPYNIESIANWNEIPIDDYNCFGSSIKYLDHISNEYDRRHWNKKLHIIHWNCRARKRDHSERARIHRQLSFIEFNNDLLIWLHIRESSDYILFNLTVFIEASRAADKWTMLDNCLKHFQCVQSKQ